MTHEKIVGISTWIGSAVIGVIVGISVTLFGVSYANKSKHGSFFIVKPSEKSGLGSPEPLPVVISDIPIGEDNTQLGEDNTQLGDDNTQLGDDNTQLGEDNNQLSEDNNQLSDDDDQSSDTSEDSI